jgi:lysophospholipase L1-like esterase
MGVPEGRLARHAAQVKAAQRSARSGGGALVLVGDSITQAWQTEGHASLLKPFRTINLGTSGDRTEQIIWRLMNGALPMRLNPLAFIVMAGTNNAGHFKDHPVHIADGVLRILELLDAAAPNAPTILYPIFPRGHRPYAAMRNLIEKTNDSLLARLPSRRNLIVRDLRTPFLDAQSNVNRALMPDFLHLSRAGYEIWAADIKQALAS